MTKKERLDKLEAKVFALETALMLLQARLPGTEPYKVPYVPPYTVPIPPFVIGGGTDNTKVSYGVSDK